jgi:prepilin-type N-terminal cleavage/methylation domain-containing protein
MKLVITKKNNQGFTLIETLVSLAIFAVVITMIVGSLLVLVSGNQRVQGEQAVVTNLTFALDSMTREIRTGTYYRCGSGTASTLFNTQEADAFGTNDCAGGNTSNHNYQGLSFREGGTSIVGAGSDRIAYFFDRPSQTIRRRIGNGAAESIVSSDIVITRAEFFVTGSAPLGASGTGNVDQPAVTITIEATDSTDVNAKPFVMQTTVTQRALDL